MKILIKRWTETGTTNTRLTFKWWGGRLLAWQQNILLCKLKQDGLYEIIGNEIRRIGDAP